MSFCAMKYKNHCQVSYSLVRSACKDFRMLHESVTIKYSPVVAAYYVGYIDTMIQYVILRL